MFQKKPKKDAENSDSEYISSDDEEKKTFLDRVKDSEPQAKPHLRTAAVEPQDDDTQDQPPFVVVVQGPKKSGKTTLIKSLVRHYTHQKISQAVGPITLRSGKNHRITLIECPNDINGMVDMAKIADLCLILVDASIGFELETFEFLSILQVYKFNE